MRPTAWASPQRLFSPQNYCSQTKNHVIFGDTPVFSRKKCILRIREKYAKILPILVQHGDGRLAVPAVTTPSPKFTPPPNCPKMMFFGCARLNNSILGRLGRGELGGGVVPSGTASRPSPCCTKIGRIFAYSPLRRSAQNRTGKSQNSALRSILNGFLVYRGSAALQIFHRRTVRAYK